MRIFYDLTESEDKVEITKVIDKIEIIEPEVIEIIEPEVPEPEVTEIQPEPEVPEPVIVKKNYEYLFTPMVFFLVFQVFLKIVIKKYL